MDIYQSLWILIITLFVVIIYFIRRGLTGSGKLLLDKHTIGWPDISNSIVRLVGSIRKADGFKESDQLIFLERLKEFPKHLDNEDLSVWESRVLEVSDLVFLEERRWDRLLIEVFELGRSCLYCAWRDELVFDQYDRVRKVIQEIGLEYDYMDSIGILRA